MNEDDIARKVVSRWNHRVDVPPFEALVKRRDLKPRRLWWRYSLAAALLVATAIVALQLSTQTSVSMSDWQSSTDFLLK